MLRRYFAWLVLLLCAAGCWSEKPLTSLERGGLAARRVQAFEAAGPSGSVVLAPGDFVLTGNGMRVVVGGLLREGSARGAVLEATYTGIAAQESLVLLTPALYVSGTPHNVRTERMFLLERRGTPTLRIEGVVVLEDRSFEVARELALGRVPGTLSLSTQVATAHPTGAQGLRLGARLAWGGPKPFVPGVGLVNDESWQRADWVGGEGATGSVAFGFATGLLASRAAFEQRDHSRLFLHTDVVHVDSFDLKALEPHYDKSALVLSPSGVGESVRKFGMWRGAMFPEVWANLPYRPDGSEVRVTDGQGRLLLNARPDSEGRVALPMVPVQGEPVREFVAVAAAYGHAPSDPHRWTAGERDPFTLEIPRGGQIRVRVRDAANQEPVAARVRLIALEQAPKPALGPDYRASGAGDTAIVLRGESAITLPAGRYAVLVTRGPEWSLHEAQVEVSETFSPRVDAVLEHQVDAAGWVGCDLHVHAAPSPDSEVALEDRLASLVAEGVQLAVATDHNHVTSYDAARSALALADLAVESGVEVTTTEPAFGHFNAYPYPLDPERPGNGAPETLAIEPGPLFDALHQLDPELVVQVNHPRAEGGIGYFDVMSLDARTGAADPRFSAAFDAIEVFNGFDLGQPEHVERVFQDWLAILARGQRVVATGSSDSHQVRYQLAGYPRTYVSVPDAERGDPRALIRALKAGASFVSSGPFLEVTSQGGGPGSTVSVSDGKLALAVRVRAPDWMPVERLEVFVGAERVLERAIPAPPRSRRARTAVRFEHAALELPIAADTFVIVRVASQTSIERFFGRYGVLPLAFTNPIFVDADGDGYTAWSPP